MRIDKNAIADFPIRMECSTCSDPLVLVAARIDEGFNQLSTARIEFVSDNPRINLDDLMGQKVELIAKVPDGPDIEAAGERERKHVGICTSARFVGTFDGACHYWAELRPKMWFLTLNRDCRIFQDMHAPDIIKEVLGDYGVSFDEQLTDTYNPRVICVQYRESDMDFVHRLMEEEGIHYYFSHEGSNEEVVLHDDSAAHTAVPCEDMIRFLEVEDSSRRGLEHMFEWHFEHFATTGKYTQTDYNFEKPKAKLETVNSQAKGNHDLKEREIYDYPGHYMESVDGDRLSRIKMEASAIKYRTWRGSGTASNIEVGKVFKISGHEATQESEEFVASAATQFFRLNDRELETLEISRFPSGSVQEDFDKNDPYQVQVSAIPKMEKYRPEPKTPWPEISGVHTAVVTGPSGEEIHTDKYGRIRIQFHWDRIGKSDDKSTCWVRHMSPWTGKGWGMISIPRIGQEVVVQFEEGDPDRPLVVGMLYNADTMPPYSLPGNMTQSGIKSRSTKGAGGDNFNELRFEDKMGEEEIYFHAEKDFTQIVENDVNITVGVDKSEPGDMSLTVHNDLTETVKTGNHTFTVETGTQTIKVEDDHTETIEKGNATQQVKMGKYTQKVDMGDVLREVGQGKSDEKVKMGNRTVEVGMGNHVTKVKLGKTTHEAMQSIEFKCGASSIKIEPAQITVKSPMVKIQGDAMLDLKAPMTTVKGDATLILKGGILLIN